MSLTLRRSSFDGRERYIDNFLQYNILNATKEITMCHGISDDEMITSA